MNILSNFDEKIATKEALCVNHRVSENQVSESMTFTTGNTERELSVEHGMTIYVNEIPVYSVVCSPTKLAELAVGRMVSEGMVNTSDIDKVYLCDKGINAKIFLKENVKFEAGRSEISRVATCCTDNKCLVSVEQEKKKLTHIIWKSEEICRLAEAMEEKLPLYSATHAVHSAFLMHNGNICYQAEDIGRHNALDKVIGMAVIDGIELSECILFSSGRVPVDMVSKAVMAGVPVFVGKGAPTAQAVDMAKEYGLTLICNARKDSFNVYSDFLE